MTKVLLIDLDGVLNTYDGNFNEHIIPKPREGVHEFLKELAKSYHIEIFTVRNKKLTCKWLQENKLDKYIYDITNVKNPYTSIIIDDRAIRFNGDFKYTLSEIKNFTPFWK